MKESNSLAEHTSAVHEEVKYPCGQCVYQVTSKGNLARYQRSVHDERRKDEIFKQCKSGTVT